MGIIDAHSHMTTKAYLKRLGEFSDPEIIGALAGQQKLCNAYPQFYDVEARLRDLDNYQIKSQVITQNPRIDPNNFRLIDEELIELSRDSNDCVAECQNDSIGRLYGLGTAPLSLSDSSAQLEEMRRAMHDLGLRGFLVLSNIRGVPIDKFRDFWKNADSLSAPVYVHPANPPRGQTRSYEDEFDLVVTFAWPFETALILSRLIFTGVAKDHPNVKIVSHHLGGNVTFLEGRINEVYSEPSRPIQKERITSEATLRPLIDYYKRFYYDTAIGSTAAVRCGYDIFGAERMIFATDYPYGMDGGKFRLATYPEMVSKAGMSKNELEQIFEGNVTRLLRL